ncbi:MAG TPA: hypothetical protein VHC49_17415 [Mycobacteriales bacterium]|nr:hypothetical protein [Mycobacteriales bacterium]
MLLTKTTSALAAIACTGLTFAASSAAAPPSRGSVISVTAVQHLSARQVRTALTAQHFDSSSVRFGVDAYRIRYRTITPKGTPTSASGLLVLPRTHHLRPGTVSYTHGTMATKAYAPSVDDGGKSLEAMTFGGAGYAAVAPDYLGLGRGPGPHPFMHVRSEVSASLDLLTAARTVAASHGRRLDPRILVTGFSQGGDVAVALARAIQNGADPRLRLRALAPISGPYELLRAELPASFDGRVAPQNAVYYLGYLLTAWNPIYHLYDNPGEAFQAPYDRTIEQLYDGFHSNEQIVTGLPEAPSRLLTPRFLHLLQHPTGRFLAAVTENDRLCDWAPRVPVRLFGARDDDHVAIANSQLCQVAFAAHRVDAPLVDVGPVGHMQSNVKGLPQILRWFERPS